MFVISLSDKGEKVKWREWVKGNFKQKLSLQKQVMLANNPQARLYVVGFKLRELFYLEFTKLGISEENKSFSFFSDVYYCFLTKYPFVEYHRDLLLMIYSKKKLKFFKGKIFNWRSREYSYIQKKPNCTIYSTLDFLKTLRVKKFQTENLGSEA